jgi:hypothetical protein
MTLSSTRHPTLAFCGSMISFRKPVSTFRIMLAQHLTQMLGKRSVAGRAGAVFSSRRVSAGNSDGRGWRWPTGACGMPDTVGGGGDTPMPGGLGLICARPGPLRMSKLKAAASAAGLRARRRRAVRRLRGLMVAPRSGLFSPGCEFTSLFPSRFVAIVIQEPVLRNNRMAAS